MSVVYIAQFSNGLLKVGMTNSPDGRLYSLKNQVKKIGVTMEDFSIYGGIADALAAERVLIKTMIQCGYQRHGKEWFVASMSDARPHLEKMLSIELARQSVATASSLVRKRPKIAPQNAALVKKLKRFRGMYKVIADETEVAYTTIRKLAGGHLPNAGIAITEPVEKWLQGRRS